MKNIDLAETGRVKAILAIPRGTLFCGILPFVEFVEKDLFRILLTFICLSLSYCSDKREKDK